MTYLVLARKYRPRSFDTLIGQDHVVRALTHALDTQRLHHAWLFTGTRGVGKTTLSRILAKSLNCETGITSKPCGVCRACTEIDAGRYVDYLELDAASNRGVDEMTQLLEQAVYAPSAGRFKVYMIDEVHMLTGHAFNAMLKTLEEPPPHVKFIIATTDPQKIPVTVLSRCLQFNLKQMPPDAIVSHLTEVLGQEDIACATPALRLIAQAAGGSMRDALSLTDQAIAYSAGNVTEEAVRGMLGTIDQRHLVRLLVALQDGAAQGVIDVANELAERGLSYTGALADLSSMLSRVAIAQRVPGALDDADPLTEDILSLAATLHPDTVQLFYTVAVHSRQELSLAPDEYAGFVMACLRMLALVSDAGPVDPPTPRPRDDGEGRSGSTGDDKANAVPASAAAPTGASASGTTSATSPRPTGPAQPSEPVETASQPPTGGPQLSESMEPVSQPVVTAGETVAAQPPPWDEVAPAGTTAATASAVSTETPTVMPTETPAVISAETSTETPTETPTVTSAIAPAGTPNVTPNATPIEPTPESSVCANANSAAEFAAPPDSDPDAHATPTGEADLPSWVSESIPDDAQSFDGASFTVDPDDDDEGFETLADTSLDSAPALVAKVVNPRPKRGGGRKRQPKVGDMTSDAWPALAAELPVTGLAAEVARQSEWLGVSHDTIRLRVAVRTLADSASRIRLQTVLCEHFGQAVRLDVVVGATGEATAHAVAQSVRAANQAAAEEAVAHDPFVQALLADFGGQVVPNTIRHVDSSAHA